MNKKPEFKYFTYFCGEVTVYRTKTEFKARVHTLIHTIKDLKPISDLAKIPVNEINKAWFVDEDGNVTAFQNPHSTLDFIIGQSNTEK